MKYALNVDIERSFFWQATGLKKIFKKLFLVKPTMIKYFYGGSKNI